jgi:multimeric flavodoxin WrbA
MKIKVYYGGRGLLDDPTLYVLNRMEDVLKELRVKVERYNIYEHKNEIATLPQTFKDADGIILATTVEWLGIGGYMQQFLDACWLYGDKDKISELYMQPIVMSTTYGEREGKLNLSTAWEILGGRPCSGICGYIANTTSMEMNQQYTTIIEKKAENMYRTIKQKISSFPASNQAVKQMVATTTQIDLTPQESEQLSEYASDDGYVQRQKEDIQELANLFRDMMNENAEESKERYAENFRKAYKSQPDSDAIYQINIENKKLNLFLKVASGKLEYAWEEIKGVSVELSMESGILEDIQAGRMTFQRAFMSGVMRMKGDFKTLRTLDQVFVFADN